jgi:hypothetical protein
MSTNLNTPRTSKRRTPSPRDQQIYLDYQLTGLRQIDLAEKHRLTQCRISQIIRHVEAWRASSNPRDIGELSANKQRRLDRWLERQRYNHILREAMRGFREEQKTVTHKTGKRGETTIDETTERRQPSNVQHLKVALSAARQLSQLEDKPHIPYDEPDARERRAIMVNELYEARKQAEAEGQVPKSHSPWAIILHLLHAALGEVRHPRSPEDEAALAQLAHALSPGEDATGTNAKALVAAQPNHGLGDADSGEDEAPANPAGWDQLAPASAGPPTEANSSTTPLTPNLPQPQTPPQLPIESPKSKIPNPTTDPYLENLRRRQEYQRKVELLRDAQRRGLPIMVAFEPDEKPPPISYQLDGYDPPRP